MKPINSRISKIILWILAVFSFLLVALIQFNPGLQYYTYAPYAFYILTPETVEEKQVPEYIGIQKTYTLTIPEGPAATTGSSLCFYLRHATAEVEVEDSDLYYSSREQEGYHIGHTTGNYWVTVPVRPVYSGKTVTITVTPVFREMEDPVFWVIGHEQLLTRILLPQDTVMLVLSVIAILAGLMLFVMAVVLPLLNREKNILLLLGATAFTGGLWKLSGLSSIALMTDIYGIHKQIWYSGTVCYLVMLVLSLRMQVIAKKEETLTCLIANYAAVVSAIVIVVLQLFDVIELHDVLVPFGIAMGLLHVLVVFEQKPTREELLWGLPFFLTLCMDMAVLKLSGSLNNAPLFLAWTLINLFVRGIGFIRDAILKERQLAEKEAELQEARISGMIQQIRPHFIYNTLTSIYVLCRENPERAMEVIADFTAYLQANFTAIAAKRPISFTDELKHTKAYLAVESMRYGDRLHVTFEIGCDAFRLPALTLQPIVENAVKYGVGSGMEQENIRITTALENRTAVIAVSDDGPGFDPKRHDDESHVGLENVRQRVFMMCKGTLEISSGEEGTKVVIRIPYQNAVLPEEKE